MTIFKISYHTNHKRHLSTICILVYISPSLVKEIASVKTKYYKYFEYF